MTPRKGLQPPSPLGLGDSLGPGWLLLQAAFLFPPPPGPPWAGGREGGLGSHSGTLAPLLGPVLGSLLAGVRMGPGDSVGSLIKMASCNKKIQIQFRLCGQLVFRDKQEGMDNFCLREAF